MRIELEALEALDTVEGARALALAVRVDSPSEGGSAATAADRQLGEIMAAIRRRRGSQVDGLAQIRAKAASKLALIK